MPQPSLEFDAPSTLSEIRQRRAMTRHRRTWGKSRLVPHRAELVKLRQAGASYAELQLWLRTKQRMKVAESTVRRFLQKLPELQKQGGNDGDVS